MNRLIWSLIFITSLLSGCISVQSYRHAAPEVIGHHTWWDHYERGRFYLKKGNYAAARRDFEIALGKNPGARYPYAQERWRARTYGLHMVEGYFPHRELGICLFRLHQLPQAVELLETSLEMEPSARAKFYLNRIREELAQRAAPAPTIELNDPVPQWTTRSSAQLTGRVVGSNEVAQITINQTPEFIELASHQIDFSREVELREGTNTIQICAEDLNGKQATTNVQIIADWTPPQISVQRDENAPILNYHDAMGLAELRMNGRTFPLHGCDHAITFPSDPTLQIRLKDRAGNQVDWSLSPEDIAYLSQPHPPTAPQLCAPEEEQTITLNTPEYALDIQAIDEAALRSLTLNHIELLSQPTPLFRSLRRVPLAIGTNRLLLTAEDIDGNRTQKTITVIYRPPEYIDQIYRLAATLKPLGGTIPCAIFQQQTDQLLTDELTRQPVRFYLLAGAREESILQRERQQFDRELADPRAALKHHQKLEADLALIPHVLSDGNGLTIYMRILDAKKKDELFVEDVYLEDLKTLPNQMAGLIMKIEQRFPLIRAQLDERDGTLTIPVGSREGAYRGMRFLVVRSSGRFEEGQMVRCGKSPAEMTASNVEIDATKVKVSRGQPKHAARAGDYVFAR